MFALYLFHCPVVYSIHPILKKSEWTTSRCISHFVFCFFSSRRLDVFSPFTKNHKNRNIEKKKKKRSVCNHSLLIVCVCVFFNGKCAVGRCWYIHDVGTHRQIWHTFLFSLHSFDSRRPRWCFNQKMESDYSFLYIYIKKRRERKKIYLSHDNRQLREPFFARQVRPLDKSAPHYSKSPHTHTHTGLWFAIHIAPL